MRRPCVLRCNVGRNRWDMKVEFLGALGGIIVAKGKNFNESFELEVEGRHAFCVEGSDKRMRLSIEEIGQRILDAVVM